MTAEERKIIHQAVAPFFLGAASMLALIAMLLGLFRLYGLV